jgi:hypothetical protein
LFSSSWPTQMSLAAVGVLNMPCTHSGRAVHDCVRVGWTKAARPQLSALGSGGLFEAPYPMPLTCMMHLPSSLPPLNSSGGVPGYPRRQFTISPTKFSVSKGTGTFSGTWPLESVLNTCKQHNTKPVCRCNDLGVAVGHGTSGSVGSATKGVKAANKYTPTTHLLAGPWILGENAGHAIILPV